jgi:hypothetical protein
MAGLAAHFYKPAAAFFIVGITGLASIVCLPIITDIDHDVARGLAKSPAEEEEAGGSGGASAGKDKASAASGDDEAPKPVGYSEVLADSRILCFCVCVFGFHLGNAAMLPMMGQKLSLGDTTGNNAMFYMAACQVVAQFTMSVVAAIVGRLANTWGRCPVFMIGFIVTPIRGLIVSLIPYSNPWGLIACELLDGTANGIFGGECRNCPFALHSQRCCAQLRLPGCLLCCSAVVRGG